MSQRLGASRWYSDAKDGEAKKAEQSSPAAAETEAQKEDPVAKELEAKKKELAEVKDRLLRQVAEYRNLQDQTKREVQAAKDFAIQRFAKDLIDSVDNLDRALQNVPADQLTDANKDLVNLHSGLKMTDTILMNTLKKHGMERLDPSLEAEKFDPNKHEAVFRTAQPGKEEGTVFFTQSKGYALNGRILKAAQVGVVA